MSENSHLASKFPPLNLKKAKQKKILLAFLGFYRILRVRWLQLDQLWTNKSADKGV